MSNAQDRTKPNIWTEGEDAVPAPEVIEVTSRRVKCDGGGGALGHPVVFYDIGADGFVECGYCDRRFVLAHGAGDGH